MTVTTCFSHSSTDTCSAPVWSSLFQSCLQTSTLSITPPGTSFPLEILCCQLWTQQIIVPNPQNRSVFSPDSREDTQTSHYLSCMRAVSKSEWHHPTLPGHCQSAATEWIHAAKRPLRVTSVGMKEGGWQEYAYSLAADLWLQGGKSRGQCTLNSSV